jgi:hypothetical protein
MFHHRWHYHAQVREIINPASFRAWVDLGFSTWKRVVLRFNRVRIKEFPADQKNPVIEFLEKTIRNKEVYVRVFKKTRTIHDLFFAEVYASPENMQRLYLKDLNRTMSNPYRIEGYVNINDILVGHGYATYFKNENEISLHNGSSREYEQVQHRSGNSNGARHQSDSSRS